MQYTQATGNRPQLSLFQEALFGGALIPTLSDRTETTPEHASRPRHISQMQLNASTSNAMLLLAPILRELSAEPSQRWLTLVAPPAELNLEWLRQARLNRERIIVLQPRGRQSAKELTEQALGLGRSHTVVSWLGCLDESGQRQLESAAAEGDTQLLNITHA